MALVCRSRRPLDHCEDIISFKAGLRCPPCTAPAPGLSSSGCRTRRGDRACRNPLCCRAERCSCSVSAAAPPAAHLPALVSSLLLALREEAARGHTLSAAAQEPGSFARLDGAVRGLLESYAQSNLGDWRRYAAFNPHSYARHLLWADDDCELMLVCWRRGQVSRVHNHGDSHCWFAVLEADVREVRYRYGHPAAEGTAAAAGPEVGMDATSTPRCGGARVRLVETQATTMQVGDVGYINDRLALHSVGCHEREGEAGGCTDGDTAGAVTLHLYCPPIRRVQVVEGSRLVETTPGFFSRHHISARGA